MMKIIEIKKNKDIYKKVLNIGLPVSFENMIYSLVNFIDIFMVGKDIPYLGLGTFAVAGLGYANQLFMIFSISLFGINSGGGILAAQYFGSKDYKKLKKCLGITIIFGFLFSLLFLLGSLIIPEKIIGIFTTDSKALESGVKYLRIVAWTYPMIGVGFAFNMQLRAIGQAKYSLYSSIIGLVTNIIANYVLIFGKLGFPPMGVEGAALATVLARIVSKGYGIYIVYKLRLPIAGKFSELFNLNWQFIVKVLKISLPVFGHEVAWVVGTSMYTIIYGRMGTDSAAAIQIVKSVSSLIVTLIFGFSSATSVIIGNEIGAGQEEKAYKYSFELLKATVLISMVIALTAYLISPIILIIMDTAPAMFPVIRKIMISEAILIITKSTGLILIVGILRAGGDTLWTMFADLIPLWFFAIPLTYVAGLKLGLPVAVVYFLSGTDEMLKIYPCIKRLKSKKWINNLVKK